MQQLVLCCHGGISERVLKQQSTGGDSRQASSSRGMVRQRKDSGSGIAVSGWQRVTAFGKATITGSEHQWQQLSLRSEIATATVRQVAVMLSEVMGECRIKYSREQSTGGDSKQAVTQNKNNIILVQWQQINHFNEQHLTGCEQRQQQLVTYWSDSNSKK